MTGSAGRISGTTRANTENHSVPHRPHGHHRRKHRPIHREAGIVGGGGYSQAAWIHSQPEWGGKGECQSPPALFTGRMGQWSGILTGDGAEHGHHSGCPGRARAPLRVSGQSTGSGRADPCRFDITSKKDPRPYRASEGQGKGIGLPTGQTGSIVLLARLPKAGIQALGAFLTGYGTA